MSHHPERGSRREVSAFSPSRSRQYEVEPFEFDSNPERAVQSLIETESATIEALQDTIPHTGHTGDSEALEHRLEDMIMRKQEQIDTLTRARRRPA
jgi:hypothetical protein